MLTRFIEATQDAAQGPNWGKLMVGRFDPEEWERRSEIGGHPMLHERGWGTLHIFVLDLQTGEGAMFQPGGSARSDLDKHRIWVCPMFEPLLAWLYAWVKAHPTDWFDRLPDLVEIPDAAFAMAGYRRPGP